MWKEEPGGSAAFRLPAAGPGVPVLGRRGGLESTGKEHAPVLFFTLKFKLSGHLHLGKHVSPSSSDLFS